MFYVWKMCQHLIAPKITQKCRQMYHTWSSWDVGCWRPGVCVWSEWLFTPPASQAKNAKVFHRGLWHVGRIILCISPIIALRESRWIIPMMALDCGSTLWLNVKDLPRYPLVIKHVNMGNPPFVYLSMIFPLKPPAGDFPGLNIEGYISFIFLCGVDFLLM